MKKKLAILMSAALLIASLAGCGQKSGGNASGGNAGSNGGGAGFPAGKNIEIIVGFAAGSATDLNARMLATYLEDELGTSVTIANREGGGGEIGWTALANAKADGYTIGVINSPAFQLPIQNPDTCKFTIDSFIPVGNMVTDPGVILVGADSPINNIEDLVAAAKANPGGVTVSVTGMNTSEARAINTLAKTFDVQFQLIPYDGSTEGINALIGNHVQVSCQNVGDILPQLAQGNVKAIAVGSKERSDLLPDVPTYGEQGLDFNQFSMRTFCVPAGTDPEIVAVLEAGIAAVMENPDFVKQAEEANVLLDYQDSASMIQVYKDLDAQWRAEWEVTPWA